MNSVYRRSVFRAAVAGCCTVGAVDVLVGLAIGALPLMVSGYTMAGIGFLTWGVGEGVQGMRDRSVTGHSLPFWAALIAVIGGLGFIAGAINLALR